MTGTLADRFARLALADGSRVDARAATFLASPANLYPFRLGGGAGVCVSGGTVSGQYDRSLGWQAMHDMNNAGVVLDGPDITLENVRVDDVEDGIRPQSGPFTVRGAWLSYVRDDCVEDDHLAGGLIDDSLFDGCYVGVSERPSPGSGLDGRAGLLTVQHSLIRLEAMPGPRGGLPTDLGHGVFFKWDPMASGLALHDDVFLAERVSQSGGGAMAMPDALGACSNNVMVWLGPGDYPAPLPACFTVTTDRGVWDRAVADWKARHGVAP